MTYTDDELIEQGKIPTPTDYKAPDWEPPEPNQPPPRVPPPLYEPPPTTPQGPNLTTRQMFDQRVDKMGGLKAVQEYQKAINDNLSKFGMDKPYEVSPSLDHAYEQFNADREAIQEGKPTYQERKRQAAIDQANITRKLWDIADKVKLPDIPQRGEIILQVEERKIFGDWGRTYYLGRFSNGAYIPITKEMYEAGLNDKDGDPLRYDIREAEKAVKEAEQSGLSVDDLAKGKLPEIKGTVTVKASGGKVTSDKQEGIPDLVKNIQDIWGKAIPPAAYSYLGAKQLTQEENQKANEAYTETLKQFAVGMIPIYGTKYYYDQAAKDGMTATEWGEFYAFVALEAIALIPYAGVVAKSARMAKGLGAASRATALGQGLKEVVIAEVTGPYNMIRHPIESAKSIVRPIRSTVGSLKGVPTSAAELRFNTIRAPVALFDNADQAMRLRDAAMASRITGGVGEAAEGAKGLKISPSALNFAGEAVAVHATPDIRPFTKGVTIEAGREGGLFIAPNLPSRFTITSAFGDLPEGNVPGAIIIRDPEILAKTKPSGKVYRGAVEMEKVIPPGTKLPEPSQYLWTYNSVGDKIQLAIIGKPYTPAEIARLKLMGTKQAVKNVFTDPLKVSKGGKKRLTAMIELEDEARSIRKEIAAAKSSGKPVAVLEKRLAATEKQYARYAENLNRQRLPVNRMYVMSGRTALDRFAEITRRAEGRRATVRGNVERVRVTIPNRPVRGEDLRRAARDAARTNRPSYVRTPDRFPELDRPPLRPDITREPPRTPPPDRAELPRVPPRTPPETPPVTPPARPPTRPPPSGGGGGGKLMPPPTTGGGKSKGPTPAQLAGAVAWPQGFGWRVAYRNDAGTLQSKFYRGQKPPKGVKMVNQGPGEATRGIQQYSGNAPVEGSLGMGAVRVTINKPQIRPGAKGTISFRSVSRITPKRPKIGR